MLSFTLEAFQRLPLWFQVFRIGFRPNTFIPVLSLSVNKIFNVAFLEDLTKFNGLKFERIQETFVNLRG